MSAEPRRHHHTIDPRLTLVIVVGVAALLVVTLFAAGVLRLGAAEPVALIGDSITSQAQGTFAAELGDEYTLFIDGKPGYKVADQLPAARQLSTADPQQVVINLGTNDVLTEGQDLDASADALVEMVGLFPDSDCIHLVTVSERMVSMKFDLQSRAEAMNESMREIVQTDDRIDVIDWAATVAEWEAAHPGASLTLDTVHPTAEGNELLSDAYAEALSSCDHPR